MITTAENMKSVTIMPQINTRATIMKGVRVSPRKTKGTAGLARAEDNETTKTKKKIQGPGAAMGRASDDASNDDSANPPYKLRDEESSESELDDNDTEAIVG